MDDLSLKLSLIYSFSVGAHSGSWFVKRYLGMPVEIETPLSSPADSVKQPVAW
jgi:hypothetical protein